MERTERLLAIREAVKALRYARRYGGKFGWDELEHASLMLGEELPYNPRQIRRNQVVG